jgi:hypothetical protein
MAETGCVSWISQLSSTAGCGGYFEGDDIQVDVIRDDGRVTCEERRDGARLNTESATE